MEYDIEMSEMRSQIIVNFHQNNQNYDDITEVQNPIEYTFVLSF